MYLFFLSINTLVPFLLLQFEITNIAFETWNIMCMRDICSYFRTKCSDFQKMFGPVRHCTYYLPLYFFHYIFLFFHFPRISFLIKYFPLIPDEFGTMHQHVPSQKGVTVKNNILKYFKKFWRRWFFLFTKYHLNKTLDQQN